MAHNGQSLIIGRTVPIALESRLMCYVWEQYSYADERPLECEHMLP